MCPKNKHNRETNAGKIARSLAQLFYLQCSFWKCSSLIRLSPWWGKLFSSSRASNWDQLGRSQICDCKDSADGVRGLFLKNSKKTTRSQYICLPKFVQYNLQFILFKHTTIYHEVMSWENRLKNLENKNLNSWLWKMFSCQKSEFQTQPKNAIFRNLLKTKSDFFFSQVQLCINVYCHAKKIQKIPQTKN